MTTLNGRCACRAIEYEVADEFEQSYICHCSRCRALTGSAFLPWGEIEPAKLRVTKGEGALLSVGDPNGPTVMRCGECYSLIYWSGLWSGYQGKIRVPYGTLTDTPSLKPTAHKFVGAKAEWYDILDDLRQYEGSPWDAD